MADRLKADIESIRHAGSTVHQISRQFAGASHLVDAYRNDLGSADLSDALHDFATNWKVHRERLCESLDAFGRWALDAADAYQRSDRELATVLESGPR